VEMAAAVAVEDMEAAVVAAVMEVVVATVAAAVAADMEVVVMAVAEEAADTEVVDMAEMAATEEAVEVAVATAVVVVMEVAVEAVVADMAVADTAEVVTRLSLDAVLLRKKHFVLRYFPFMLNLYYSAMQYCKNQTCISCIYIRTETYNPKTPLRTLKKLYDRYDGVWTLTS